jgi:hypothetical protein
MSKIMVHALKLYGAWGMHLEASNNMMLNMKKIWFV